MYASPSVNGVPPLAITVAIPFVSPKQVSIELIVVSTINATNGSTTVRRLVVIEGQPIESVIVQV